MSRIARILLALVLLPLSCSDEAVTNKYCNLPARFQFTPVNSISQLYSSCESMGEWCTITLSGNKFYFSKPNDKKPGEWPRVQLDGYTGFYMGLSGFILGLPNIPEVGETMPVVTCYDLACRNCWDDYMVSRKMELREGGLAFCSRCQRTYDLNNTGQVRLDPGKHETNHPLLRYRVYYGNNTLSINNQ